MHHWTEEEEQDAKRLLREYPTKTYREIAEMTIRDTTWKAISRKNERQWNIERNVKSSPGHQKGKDNGNWKGGKAKHKKGYIMQYAPDHPRGDPYVFEHILVAEKKIGRRLRDDEVVHHKNGNITDNDPENLEVMTNAEHTRLHMTGSKH